MTYSTLDDARSYFGADFEARLVDQGPALDAELEKLAGEPEHILDAVRELAAFQQLRRLANRKLRAHNPSKPRLNESQTTAIEYLFGHRHEGATSWGKFADHVNRRHRVGRYRIGRQLNALEDAGVIRVTRETSGDVDVRVELVLAGVKRAPGSKPIAGDALGHALDMASSIHGGVAGDCAKCGARIAWSSTGSPDGHPRYIAVDTLSPACPGSDDELERATYCACETPVIDVEHDAGCRRCGRPVDFSPQRAAALETIAAGLRDLGGEPVTTWPSRDELRAEGRDPDTGAKLELDFVVGDVVYAEGASAIEGDVIHVDESGVTIQWRPTHTVEQAEDLVLVSRPERAPSDHVDLAALELELVTGTQRMSDTEFSVKAERFRQAGGYWPRGVADWTTPAGRELAARIREARS